MTPAPSPSITGVRDEESDAHLVVRVLSGETPRYAELVARYQGMLYRHARGMVRDPDLAADLVQEAFVKAYTRLESCRDPARFGAWLHRILVNRCRDHLKRQKRRFVPLEEETVRAPEGEGPARQVERGELGRVLEGALAALPGHQREAFLLKHLDGLSYEEMAETLGASVSALKMRVLRARGALQALLRETASA